MYNDHKNRKLRSSFECESTIKSLKVENALDLHHFPLKIYSHKIKFLLLFIFTFLSLLPRHED